MHMPKHDKQFVLVSLLWKNSLFFLTLMHWKWKGKYRSRRNGTSPKIHKYLSANKMFVSFYQELSTILIIMGEFPECIMIEFWRLVKNWKWKEFLTTHDNLISQTLFSQKRVQKVVQQHFMFISCFGVSEKHMLWSMLNNTENKEEANNTTVLPYVEKFRTGLKAFY